MNPVMPIPARLINKFAEIRDRLALPSYHRGAAHDAISADLVRLSLPHRPSTDRPELRV